MKRWLFSLAIAFALMLGALPGAARAQEPGTPQALAASPLWIETTGGTITLDVELAQSPEEWATGLMFRTAMPETHGMLFFYPTPRPIAMWMKNTYIPLDMVFILSDGTISSIAENTVPQSLAIISSRGPASAVLELNAGVVKKLGIRAGETVHHAVFGNAPAARDNR
jgi:uncharacterized protein